MNPKVKLTVYAVLLLLVAWFGWGFYSNYTAVTRESAAPATNEAAPAPTNVTTTATTNVDTNTDTNTVAATTNTTATNVAVAPQAAPPSAPAGHPLQGRMIGYLGALVVAFICLGLLITYDLTHYVGSAAVDAILDDQGEGMRDPDYERAEAAWANGKHLDAIQMMRDFLKTHPREQYAALRIAEIYEKDLNNPLAAALEYEEVLKKKLPPERWGWAAVHLCNLYSRLGRQEKTRALLQRIVDEYPKTAAAKKARNRLGLAEPEPEPEPEHTAPAGEAPAAPHGQQEQLAPAPESPKSNLPPGFRPKK